MNRLVGRLGPSLLPRASPSPRRLLAAAKPDQTAGVRLLVLQNTVRAHVMTQSLKAFDAATIA